MMKHTMMFTMNGEFLLDDPGSELSFKDFDTDNGKCYMFRLVAQRGSLFWGFMATICV